MKADHLEFLVEEPSMEVFLATLLPKLLAERATYRIHAHQGKSDLLRKLGARLRGYRRWLAQNTRIVVVLDRDNQDCHALKQKLEAASASAGLVTRASAPSGIWQVVNRIAIEELGAWYFGEWAGVRGAYPRLPASLSGKPHLRDPDAIQGGTWEASERPLQAAGYFNGGLRKLECARAIGIHLDPARNISPSFTVFRDAILEAVADP